MQKTREEVIDAAALAVGRARIALENAILSLQDNYSQELSDDLEELQLTFRRRCYALHLAKTGRDITGRKIGAGQ